MPSNQLRSIRKRCGFSQRKVAEIIGVSAATVNRHEQGTRGVDRETALKYSRLYKVPVVELYSPVLINSGVDTCQQTTES